MKYCMAVNYLDLVPDLLFFFLGVRGAADGPHWPQESEHSFASAKRDLERPDLGTDLERPDRPRVRCAKIKNASDTSATKAWSSMCVCVGGGCCIGRHAVGRLEGVKRRARKGTGDGGSRDKRTREQVETRGQESTRGYGCKA